MCGCEVCVVTKGSPAIKSRLPMHVKHENDRYKWLDITTIISYEHMSEYYRKRKLLHVLYPHSRV